MRPRLLAGAFVGYVWLAVSVQAQSKSAAVSDTPAPSTLSAPLEPSSSADASALSPVSMESWTDSQLLEAADHARQGGDCAFAMEAYEHVVSRAGAAEGVTRALYGQGLCLESAEKFDEALMRFETLVVRFPLETLADDALFRKGVVLEHLKLYADSEACYRKLLKEYPLDLPSDARAVKVQLAWALLWQGETRAALRWLHRVEAEYAQERQEDLRDERFYVGKTHLALGALLSSRADDVDFRPSTLRRATLSLFHLEGDHWYRKRLKEREKWMSAARAHYEQAAQQGNAIWISAAYLLSGLDVLDYYGTLNEAPVPPRLSDEEKAEYQALVREATRDYLTSAGQLLLRGHELAVGASDRSAWAKELEALAQVIDTTGIDGLIPLSKRSGAFFDWEKPTSP